MGLADWKEAYAVPAGGGERWERHRRRRATGPDSHWLRQFKSAEAIKKQPSRWDDCFFGAAIRFAVPDKIFGLTLFLDFIDRCTTAGSAASATGGAEPPGQILTGDLILTNYFEAIFALRCLS